MRMKIRGFIIAILIITITTALLQPGRAETPKEQREKLVQNEIDKVIAELTNFSKDQKLTAKEMKQFVKETKNLERLYKDSVKIYGELNVTEDKYQTLVKIKNLYTGPKWKWGHMNQPEMKRLIGEITGYDILEIEETLTITWHSIFLIMIMILGVLFAYTGVKEKSINLVVWGAIFFAVSFAVTIALLIGAI